MTKKFFTRVSPRAVEGIRRVYENKGAEVHAKIQADGSSIVVVIMQDSDGEQSRPKRKQKREETHATA